MTKRKDTLTESLQRWGAKAVPFSDTADLFMTPGIEEALERLDAWTRGAQTGHRSALPELVSQNLWDRIARDTDVCMGSGGPYWDRCLSYTRGWGPGACGR